MAGLACLVRGQLLLTKKGSQLLNLAHRRTLWALVLDTLTNCFLWASHDGYLSQTVGQTGWAYSVYLLARFGDQPQPVSFYAERYQRAFPFVRAEFTNPAYRTPLEQLTHCYGVRTFERGINWFGLLGPELQSAVLHQADQPLSASPLLAQFLDVQQGPA